jgi:hypothetical protein
VFSKFATKFIILGSIFGVCTAVGAPGYWTPGNLLNILRAFCGLQLFGVMLISGRFAFGQKAGAVVRCLLALGLIDGCIELQKRAPVRAESLGQLAVSGPGTIAICVTTLLIAALMCVLVGQWLSSRDTSQQAE